MSLKLGIKDPEQFLEDCPDRVWGLWEAYAAVEPFGGERELLAKILGCLLQLVADSSTDKDLQQRLDAVNKAAATLLPSDWVERTEQGQESSIDAAQKTLEAMFG